MGRECLPAVHIFCPVFTLSLVRPPLRERFREDRVEHHLFCRDLQFFGDDGREAFFISEAIRLELLAHFAPETLDLELLGGQAAWRGLQGTPCPVVRAGHAFAVRSIDGKDKDGLTERRAGLAVQCNAYHSGAFFLGIIAGGGDDSGCQLVLADGGRIPSGYVVPLFVLFHQNDTDIIAQPSGDAFIRAFFGGRKKLGFALFIRPD